MIERLEYYSGGVERGNSVVWVSHPDRNDLADKINEIIDVINEITQTADVVEVVRCKDCRWGREACGNIECNADLNVPAEYHGHDWFCPNGERREDDND